MTDCCEPPEHLRGVDGWHWVQNDAGEPVVVKWEDPCWKVSGRYFMPEEMVEAGNSYLAPVPSPEAVRALVEAVRTLRHCYAGPVGFAAAVRQTTGLAWPWEAEADALAKADAALLPFEEPGT